MLVAVGAAFIARRVAAVVHAGPGVRHGPVAAALELERVVALGDADVAHLAPELAPAVPNNPILAKR